jgi:hypothetical protein
LTLKQGQYKQKTENIRIVSSIAAFPPPMVSSSTVATSLAAALSAPLTEKLSCENFLFWQAQVLPALLRGAQVMEQLDGSDLAPAETLDVEDEEMKMIAVPNLSYGIWIVRDQQVTSRKRPIGFELPPACQTRGSPMLYYCRRTKYWCAVLLKYHRCTTILVRRR